MRGLSRFAYPFFDSIIDLKQVSTHCYDEKTIHIEQSPIDPYASLKWRQVEIITSVKTNV